MNKGLLIPNPPYAFSSLVFNLRRNVLLTVGFSFDLSLLLQSGPNLRGHFQSGLRSLHICSNGEHVVVVRQPKEEPVGLLLELRELGSASPKFTRTFWGHFVRVFAVGPSGRFVAISKEKQLLRRRPQATEEERFPFTILDTETGSEFTFSNTWKILLNQVLMITILLGVPGTFSSAVLNRGPAYSLPKESNMTGRELAMSGAGCKTAGLTLVKSS